MRVRRTGFLATFVMAIALPAAGLAEADTPTIDEVAAPLADQTSEPDLPVLAPIGGGMASYYGRELAGARTASGQRFDPAGFTAAHRTLPFGTRVQVTNPATGDSVVVTINDRGPFHGNRVIDLSEAAARRIGIARTGSGKVQLAVLQPAG